MSIPALRCLAAFGVALMLIASPMPARGQTAPSPEQNSDAFALSPTGYVQFDVRAFPGWDVVPGEGRVSRDRVEVRRARLGVEGRWRRVNFELSIDPQDSDGWFVKDAYAQLRFSSRLRLRAGQFKLPGTRDYDVSARDLNLLERTPLAESLGVTRDIGVRVDGRLSRVRYDLGAFAGDGVNRDDRAGLTVAARVVTQVTRTLEIGGSMSRGRTRSTDSEPANGASIQSTSGFRFADGVYVQGARTRLGADAAWTPGRWRFAVEGLRLHDERLAQGLDREHLPAAIGTGFSGSVSRRLRTGKRAAGNAIINAMLRRPVDLTIRYDYIAFDDAGDSDGSDSVRPRATNIRPQSGQGLTLGSTWAVNRWLKLLGNVGAEQFSETRSAPNPGRTGTYLTLGARLQVEWR